MSTNKNEKKKEPLHFCPKEGLLQNFLFSKLQLPESLFLNFRTAIK